MKLSDWCEGKNKINKMWFLKILTNASLCFDSKHNKIKKEIT